MRGGGLGLLLQSTKRLCVQLKLLPPLGGLVWRKTAWTRCRSLSAPLTVTHQSSKKLGRSHDRCTSGTHGPLDLAVTCDDQDPTRGRGCAHTSNNLVVGRATRARKHHLNARPSREARAGRAIADQGDSVPPPTTGTKQTNQALKADSTGFRRQDTGLMQHIPSVNEQVHGDAQRSIR